jgi:epoxyqueuosine reductase QueG
MKERLRKIILHLARTCAASRISTALPMRPPAFTRGHLPRLPFGGRIRPCSSGGLTNAAPPLIYGHFNYAVCPVVDWIGFRAAREIERLSGGAAVPLPSDGPYEYWDAEKMEGRGLISMKHAAVLAGLGTLARVRCCCTRPTATGWCWARFWPKRTSPPTRPPEASAGGLPSVYRKLPFGALDGMTVSQLRCRNHTYITNSRGFQIVNCGKCRFVCPMQGGKGSQR